jgi:phosphatidate cytidylyltransferase
MSLELKKRIITSIFLISLLVLMYLYSFILIIGLIIIALITWIEFYAIISKIFFEESSYNKTLRFLSKSISLIYLSSLIYIIIIFSTRNPDLRILIFYSILVSIASDIGGLIIGKMLKGKKLTKISPKKTISGSIGSFVFPLFLIPFFLEYFNQYQTITLFFITTAISLISQIGDLFISFLKRKAKVKDTSDILPGHGGFLDRIDGIIFSIPSGLLLFNIF